MATSNVEVSEGTGKKLATHSLTEDAVTKHISRANINDSAGADILGSKTDDKSTATDTTSVSAISLWKQISASIQTLAGAVGSAKVATKSASGDFADGSVVTLGAKADAKSTATDTTAITVMQVIKQISASIQAAATSLAGTLTVSGVVTNTHLTNFGSGEYETVAAAATAQVLGPSGATGDYISGVLVIPATTSPGNVLLLDNATSITIFTGGSSSVSNLVPFFIPLGMISVSGAWKLTTGSNVSCIGIGNFT